LESELLGYHIPCSHPPKMVFIFIAQMLSTRWQHGA